MKPFRKILHCILALGISSVILYGDLLYSFPSEINMYTNELHNASLGAGVFISDVPKDICTWDGAGGVTPLKDGEYTATLKFANALPFKKIQLKVSSPQEVCASGELIGLRLHNKGLIVTGTAPVKNNGKSSTPSRDAGILPGDVILEINGKEVYSGDSVSSLLTENSSIKILRNNSIKTLSVSPARDDEDGLLKMGVWVRDSTAGIGTLTFYDKESLCYGALGHAVSDSDTGVLFTIHKGSIEKSSVVSVSRGTSGTPGEIVGSFSAAGNVLGAVEKNCDMGIFGKFVSEATLNGKIYPVGVMSQVKEGKATILSTVDDTTKEYEIKILRSMPFGSATKGMMIEVTDKDLLSKTGGIVQGMSGSPIIQNGKLIGAVTHVLVNDPTRGYGIFIENMLSEAEKIK